MRITGDNRRHGDQTASGETLKSRRLYVSVLPVRFFLSGRRKKIFPTKKTLISKTLQAPVKFPEQVHQLFLLTQLRKVERAMLKLDSLFVCVILS